MPSAKSLLFLIINVILVMLVSYYGSTFRFSTFSHREIEKKAREDMLISVLKKNVRKDVSLLVAVFSSYRYEHRRNFIRETWLRECHTYNKCVGKFILDGIIPYRDKRYAPENFKERLANESARHNGDIIIADTYVGMNFAYRYIKVLLGFQNDFNYDFFLRVDDDVYLCIHKIMMELAFRRQHNFLVWGFVRCCPLRVDEGILIVSKNLANAFFILDNPLCGQYATEAVSAWIYNVSSTIGPVEWFSDNLRIWHQPPAGRVPALFTRSEICHTFVALHGIYTNKSFTRFHEIAMAENRSYGTPVPPVFNHWSNYYKKGMIYPKRGHDPHLEPCKQSPLIDDWNHGGGFVGREAEKLRNFPLSAKENFRD